MMVWVSWMPGMTCTFSLTKWPRSEEHTSELQSHLNLVCRLLLEKKKNQARNELPPTDNGHEAHRPDLLRHAHNLEHRPRHQHSLALKDKTNDQPQRTHALPLHAR